MPHLAQNLELLVAAKTWGYLPGTPSAAEPAAWTSLALAAHGRTDAAGPPARWLAEIQSPGGSVGITCADSTPGWPTSLAILAWAQLGAVTGESCFAEQRNRAVQWALEAQGTTAPQQAHVGHNTLLTGWSWADRTHSWVEPTAMFILALKAVGLGDHPRAREGVRLLVDRLLPTGGSNYGNTVVLGQALVPHVQPTGLALLALAGEDHSDPRIEKSLQYLQHELSGESSTASLCYGLQALTVHGRRPERADTYLAAAFDREMAGKPSCYKLALLALATLPSVHWLSPIDQHVVGAVS